MTEPVDRIVCVVAMLGGLDVIEEVLVHGCRARRRDRFQQRPGPRRVGTRNGQSPLLQPVVFQGRAPRVRRPFEEGAVIDERMSDESVAPIQQDQAVTGPPKVAGMEISVDQRIR